MPGSSRRSCACWLGLIFGTALIGAAELALRAEDRVQRSARSPGACRRRRRQPVWRHPDCRQCLSSDRSGNRVPGHGGRHRTRHGTVASLWCAERVAGPGRRLGRAGPGGIGRAQHSPAVRLSGFGGRRVVGPVAQSTLDVARHWRADWRLRLGRAAVARRHSGYCSLDLARTLHRPCWAIVLPMVAFSGRLGNAVRVCRQHRRGRPNGGSRRDRRLHAPSLGLVRPDLRGDHLARQPRRTPCAPACGRACDHAPPARSLARSLGRKSRHRDGPGDSAVRRYLHCGCFGAPAGRWSRPRSWPR